MTDLIFKEDYFGFIYEWTDLHNGKKYIGSHKGSTRDGYTGSGKLFLAAYKKRADKFNRIILEYVDVDDWQLLLDTEQRWLDSIPNIHKNPMYYNLTNNVNYKPASLINVYERKRRGEFTKAEAAWIETNSQRRRDRDFTPTEIKHYKRTADRKRRGEFTEAELAGLKISVAGLRKSQEKQNKRKSQGDFTVAEINGWKNRSERMRTGNLTDKEEAAFEENRRRKSAGEFTEAELAGVQKRLKTMSEKRKLDPNYGNVSPEKKKAWKKKLSKSLKGRKGPPK